MKNPYRTTIFQTNFISELDLLQNGDMPVSVNGICLFINGLFIRPKRFLGMETFHLLLNTGSEVSHTTLYPI